MRISSPASFGVALLGKRSDIGLSNDLPAIRSRELSIIP